MMGGDLYFTDTVGGSDNIMGTQPQIVKIITIEDIGRLKEKIQNLYNERLITHVDYIWSKLSNFSSVCVN
jgi:hypothetical protein